MAPPRRDPEATEPRLSRAAGKLPPPGRAILSWVLFALLLGLTVLAAALFHEPPPEPPRVAQRLPDFELRNQDGRPVDRARLEGRIWVADFIFTSCAASCPAMNAKMQELARRIEEDPELAGRVGLLSFSLDPARDTPQVLRRFGERLGADFDRWWFVTGPEGAVAALCRDGFFLSPGREGEPLLHSDRFVLVDARSRVRGYYRPAGEPEALSRLLADLRAVVREPR